MTGKKRLTALLAALGCIAALTVGCGAAGPQTATLQLAANPTTGYEWTVEQDPEIFDVTMEFAEEQTAEPMVGVGGTETIVLTPKEEGTSKVSFVYSRPGEANEGDTRMTYTLKVDKKMRIEMEAFTGEMDGSINEIPEAPELLIE